ncbi:ribonuclease G [Lactococcus petauri]|uniref:ribonuclease G n=1 Tax=Lactococcus petauri TaxID=1940789 RepID=UPI003851E6D7
MEKQNFETKWNWGAFLDPLGFGVGNRAYLCLLAFVPLLNIVWIFISGAKAESWALANTKNKYRDEKEFRNIMDSWKRAGFVKFIVYLAFFVLYFLLIVAFGTLAISTYSNY